MQRPNLHTRTEPRHDPSNGQSNVVAKAEALLAMVRNARRQRRPLTFDEQQAVNELVETLRLLVDLTDDVDARRK